MRPPPHHPWRGSPRAPHHVGSHAGPELALGLTVPAPTWEHTLGQGLPSCRLISAGSPVQPSGGPPATRTPRAEGTPPCSPHSDRGLGPCCPPLRGRLTTDTGSSLLVQGLQPPGRAVSPGQGGAGWSSPPGHTGCSGWGAGGRTGPGLSPTPAAPMTHPGADMHHPAVSLLLFILQDPRLSWVFVAVCGLSPVWWAGATLELQGTDFALRRGEAAPLAEHKL